MKRAIAASFVADDPDHSELIATIPTPLNSKTGLFVPEFGELFAGVVQSGDKGAEVSVCGAK
jgi:hypothetical protein